MWGDRWTHRRGEADGQPYNTPTRTDMKASQAVLGNRLVSGTHHLWKCLADNLGIVSTWSLPNLTVRQVNYTPRSCGEEMARANVPFDGTIKDQICDFRVSVMILRASMTRDISIGSIPHWPSLLG